MPHLKARRGSERGAVCARKHAGRWDDEIAVAAAVVGGWRATLPIWTQVLVDAVALSGVVPLRHLVGEGPTHVRSYRHQVLLETFTAWDVTGDA